MPGDETHPLVVAGLRVGGGLLAALVVAGGLFDESLPYAVVVGLAVGLGFAAIGHLTDRLGADRFDHS